MEQFCPMCGYNLDYWEEKIRCGACGHEKMDHFFHVADGWNVCCEVTQSHEACDCPGYVPTTAWCEEIR
jgi:hypothetical protein